MLLSLSATTELFVVCLHVPLGPVGNPPEISARVSFTITTVRDDVSKVIVLEAASAFLSVLGTCTAARRSSAVSCPNAPPPCLSLPPGGKNVKARLDLLIIADRPLNSRGERGMRATLENLRRNASSATAESSAEGRTGVHHRVNC